MKLLLVCLLLLLPTIGMITTVNAQEEQKSCNYDKNDYLYSFSCGRLVTDDDGKGKIREFTLILQEHTILNITDQGQQFDGWTYNGTIPGPTMRMTEGDNVRIKLVNPSTNNFTHSIHMHSIHNGNMDGAMMVMDNNDNTEEKTSMGFVGPGEQFIYEFQAQPFGVYPYHCHVPPVADHINRGLYGMMIIDPKEPRSQATEMAMLMNGYDLNYEQEGEMVAPPEVNHTDPLKFIASEGDSEERDNEIYTVNGKAFEYNDDPIDLKVGETYRIYLANMLEFDLVNSFHVHGMMFHYIPVGTTIEPLEQITDVVTLGQGDRGIIEITPTHEGLFMFHAHVTEFTDLGWVGVFNVTK